MNIAPIIRAICLSGALTGFAGDLRAEHVKIGAILPLSGPAASIGASQNLGISIAVKEINERPSKVGLLDLFVEDDGGRPDVAVAKLSRLLDQERVRYIVGVPLSASALGVQKRTDSDGVLFVSTGGTLSLPEARSETTSLRFHIGNNLGDLTKIKEGVEKRTVSKPTQAVCLGQSPAFSDDEDFAICPFAFADRSQWNDFLAKVKRQTNNESSANLDAAIAYVAVKMLYEAMELSSSNPSEITPQRTAAVFRTQSFTTIFGKRSFGREQAILTTPVLVLNPSRNSDNKLPSLLSKLAAESKDKCDDCKTTNECPQGAANPVLSKEDCCKKTNDCPQGIILRSK